MRSGYYLTATSALSLVIACAASAQAPAPEPTTTRDSESAPGSVQADLNSVTGAVRGVQRAAEQPVAPRSRANQFDDIVVTARRVEERAQDIPLAVTAIGGDNLHRQQIVEVKNLVGNVPSLYLQQSPQAAAAAYISLRGQRQTDTLLTTDATTGIYIDGVYLPRSLGMRGQMVDLQRVEVLRGPQGTLYGRNTTGGAISIVTQDPRDDLGGSIDAYVATRKKWGVTGVLNLPVGEGIGLRLAGHHSQTGRYGSTAGGYGIGNDNLDFFRAKLKIESGDFTAKLIGSYQNYNAGQVRSQILSVAQPGTIDPAVSRGGNAAPFTGGAVRALAADLGISLADAYTQALTFIKNDPNENGDPRPSFSKFEAYAATMDLTWSASDAVTLRSISSYQHFDRVSNLVNSGEALKGTAGYNNTRFYALSQEFQILGSVSNLNYVVGAYGGIEKGKEDALNQAGSILLPTPATSARGGNLGDVTNKNIAAFAQVNWKITPELTFTAGGRYTVEQKKVFSHNYTLRNSTGLFFCSLPLAVVDDPANFNVNNVATCNAHFKKSFKDPSWLLSLDYKPIEDVTVYGKVSRGFRSGGLQLRGSTNPDSFTPYDPEYVTEYEIGLKSDLFDRRLRLNLAAYHSDYKGIQRSVVIPLNNQAVSLVTNAAAGRVNGVEVETFLRVSPQFTIGGNASWVDGKYKRFFDVSLGDRTGEDFGVPHFTAGVNSEYTVPTSIGQITFTGNYTFQGNTVLAPDSPFPEAVESGKIGLLNGRVTLAIDQLDAELSVFGTNLTNKFYYSGANSYYRALGFEIGFVGEPRVVGIEFKKHFGR